jgi:transposase
MGRRGKDSAALDRFFAELGRDRAKQLTAVSMDMGKAYPKSVAEHAPQATICSDPFHVIALAIKALDTVCREHWNAYGRPPQTTPASSRTLVGGC